MSQRYDRRSGLYERHWAPVLAPTALRLLDLAAPWLPPDGEGRTVLDVGTGTGTLVVAAAQRWPAADIIGSDLSTGMLAVARAAARDLPRPPRLMEGAAEAIPLPDASVDLALSSFVLQLVPDRPAALREIRRVLRPGAAFAYVTWLEDDRPFAPHDAFDEAVLDLEIEEADEDEPQRAGDVVSPAAAMAQLRRAGFRAVGARSETLEHAWTPESYLDFKFAYDEEALVASLTGAQRQRLVVLARQHLAGLGRDDFRWRADVVLAWGRRPS
jgi:ubiquinone/menaquinone biosynthesis C-methylase UbiE